MKLVTFQSLDALRELIDKGYLVCKDEYINTEKYGKTYNWIAEKMNNKIPNNSNTNYPLWAWVKFKNGIYPPKHKGNHIKGFDVKITFNKPDSEVFITDFRRYSFILNNTYIPDNIKDKELFDKELKDNNITQDELKAFMRYDKYLTHRQDKIYLDICNKIRKSFDKCITKSSDVLQGCVWEINLNEVENIEILTDNNYTYGSFNYVRSNGKRFDWIDDLYRRLV